MPLAALQRIVDNLGPYNPLIALPFRTVIDLRNIGGRGRGGISSPDVAARAGVKSKGVPTTLRCVNVRRLRVIAHQTAKQSGLQRKRRLQRRHQKGQSIGARINVCDTRQLLACLERMLVRAIEAHATATLSETILKRRRHTSALKSCRNVTNFGSCKRERETERGGGRSVRTCPLARWKSVCVTFDAHLAECGRVAATRVRVNSELNTYGDQEREK